MVVNCVKKLKLQENNEKKQKSFFPIEVHFLIAGPNGHPSKYWLRSMLLNFCDRKLTIRTPNAGVSVVRDLAMWFSV